MKKDFIILFIITIMLMIATFILAMLYQYDLNVHNISFQILIIILCILLIIFAISLFIYAQKYIRTIKNIKNNEKVITLTSIVLFGIIILGFITNYVSQMLFLKRSELMLNDANKFISVVENINKKNYMFMLKDIKNNKLIDSPFGNKYKNNSYVTTFNGNNNVCLTDGKYSVIKNTNTKKLELVKGDTCNYELNEKDAALFINSKLFEKYNVSFEVYNCKRNYDYDSVFNNKTGVTCEIKYNDKSYSATLYDEKLELKDNYYIDYDK